MKLADKVAAIEEKTYQAAMLQTARSFDDYSASFYAALLIGLAERGALKRGCDELQRLAKQYADRPLDSEAQSVPEWSHGLSDATLLNVIMWDVFTTTPHAWRLSGGEAALLTDLREADESHAAMSNSEYKYFLNIELEKLAKVKS